MPPGIYPALFSGSGGISSAAVPDPYVPVDGTMNVTGALTVSDTLTVTGAGSLSLLGGQFVIADAAAGGIFLRLTNGQNLIVDDGTNTLFSVTDLGAVGAMRADFAGPVTAGASWTIRDTAGSALATFVDNGTTGTFKSSGGLAAGGVTAVKSAAYIATIDDSLVRADPNAAAGSFAITLPAANAAKGQLLTVKVVTTHATRVITVIRAGADTINGVTAGQTTTTFTTTAALASAAFQSDGTSVWDLIASNGTVS